jgi:uncharacterized metal-binding protein
MSFETESQDNNAQNVTTEQRQQPTPTAAAGQRRKVLVLRARQAALDVVLDGCSVIRAQARLMSCVDKDDWIEVFNLAKEEIQHQRDELLQNATLADALRMAEDTGEDIEAFARRTGTSLEDIAQVLDGGHNDSVKL